EPWGYILESQADADLILNWDEFAWGKDSTNTVVAATNAFKENEAHSKAYLDAHVKAVDFIKENPEESQALVIEHIKILKIKKIDFNKRKTRKNQKIINENIKDLTSKEIDKKELEVAFSRLEVTTFVNKEVVQEMADISKEAEYVESNDIDGLIDLSILEGLE